MRKIVENSIVEFSVDYWKLTILDFYGKFDGSGIYFADFNGRSDFLYDRLKILWQESLITQNKLI